MTEKKVLWLNIIAYEVIQQFFKSFLRSTLSLIDFCNDILFTRHQKNKNFSYRRSSRPEVFLEKGFGKYVANLQENNHAEVSFQ